MRLLQRILLAYDFSTSSHEVVAAAVELAKTFDSTVIPVHVLPEDLDNEKVKALIIETANTKLADAANMLSKEGCTVGDPILTFGSPHNGIVQASVDTNANLILVGSGTREADESFQLGITAERIVQESEKPVFVVKGGDTLSVKHILCPVDLSATSKQALRNAITMAYRFKARLTILSVCEIQSASWFSSKGEHEKERDEKISRRETELDKFLKSMNLAGLNWNKKVVAGTPAKEILASIERDSVDLLVMGTIGRTGLSRMIMGSVTEKVIREVPCSFITIKSEDVIKLRLENNIADIEKHYEIGQQLLEDGFFEAAINQFQACLSINRMHVPSFYAIARVYDKMNEPQKAQLYRDSGREIMDRIWNLKIETEVRKLKGH